MCLFFSPDVPKMAFSASSHSTSTSHNSFNFDRTNKFLWPMFISSTRSVDCTHYLCKKKSGRWGSTGVLTRQLQVARKSPKIKKQEQPSIGAGTGDRKQSIAPILGLACARGQAGPLRENGSVFMSFIDLAGCICRGRHF